MHEPAPPPLLDGRYRLGERLGEGGASVVYRARDERLGAERALKLLHPRVRDDAMRARLEAEARAMARLEHPHVLRVYDVGEHDDRPYVVMALARGSLADVLEAEGPQPAEVAVPWMLQALSALAAAHAVGVVHRDVKPQNLLQDGTGAVVLADFGIAMLTGADHERSTRTGMAMGSLAYMAPEQRLDARRVGPQADLYAVGASLYHLLTGASPMDLFVATPDSGRWHGVAPALRRALAHATRYEPSHRPPTAAAMAAELVAALGHMGLSAAVPSELRDVSGWPPPSLALAARVPEGAAAPPWVEPTVAAVDPTMATPPPAPAARRRPPVAWGLLTLLVGVVGFAGWWALRPPPADPLREATPGGHIATPQPRPDPPADAEPAPEAAPEAAPETAPPPVAAPAPAPRAAPAIAEAPAPETAPEGGASAPPFGRWHLNLNGAPFRLQVTGSPAAVRAAFLGGSDADPVRVSLVGSYDPEARVLVLEAPDPSQWDAARYTLTLDPETRTLAGPRVHLQSRQTVQVVAQGWEPL